MNDNKTAHASNEYDSGIKTTIPYYSIMHNEIINFIKVYNKKPANWLDIGCGTGTLIQKAENEFTGTNFYICDPSKEMLTIAKDKLGNTVESLGAIDTLAIRDEFNDQFDIITAIQCFHYLSISSREESLKRCYKLLQNDGLFITFENTSTFTTRGVEIFKEYWKQFQINSGKDPKKAEAHMQRYNVEYFPISIINHLELLKSIGFKIVEMFWYSYMQSGYICIK